MNTSAVIADPLLRRASGRRARPSDPPRTARVRIGFSRLRAPVSRRGSAISRRTVMNNAGLPGSLMNTYCDNRSSRPARLFSFSLLDSLSGCLCRLHLREATAGFGLNCLATAFMNNHGYNIMGHPVLEYATIYIHLCWSISCDSRGLPCEM